MTEDAAEAANAAVTAYERGEYFRAHEAFEHAWLASGSPRSVELHALAQLAAAVHKRVTSGKPVAASAIMRRARDKFTSLEASALGIDLVRLVAGIDVWLVDMDAPAPAIERRR